MVMLVAKTKLLQVADVSVWCETTNKHCKIGLGQPEIKNNTELFSVFFQSFYLEWTAWIDLHVFN